MGKKRNLAEAYHPSETFAGCTTIMRWKHCIVPGLNLNDELSHGGDTLRDISKLYESPFLRIGKPLPCISSSYQHLTNDVHTDPALALVRSKYLWRRRKKRLQELLLSKRRSKEIAAALKDIKHLHKWKKLPYGVVKLADHLNNNPDVHFKGVYNWYQGNSLACTVFNDENYLFFVGGPKLDHLYIANFDHHLSSVSVPVVFPKTDQLTFDGPIYDVVSYDNCGTVGVRTRNKCTFVSYRDDGANNIVLQNYVAVKGNDFPFISLDVVADQFCTIDANHEIKFWDPSKKTATTTVTLPKTESFLPNKFARIRYDPHTEKRNCLVADRRNVHFFDQRLCSFNSQMLWKLDSFVEPCEDISVIVPSLTEYCWYVGSNHTCLLLDVRKGFIQKWVHMLPQTPALGHSFRINKECHNLKEAVILSTQSTNDMVAIYEKWSSEMPESSCFPVSLPSRIDTLHECRMNGFLTDHSLRNVFDFSIIGLSAYRRKSKMGIFSLVSTGDIFHHRVKRNLANDETNFTDHLTESDFYYVERWERDLMERRKKYDRSIKATSIMDMSNMILELRSRNDEALAWSKKEYFDEMPMWKISRKSLNSYADYLAPRLIAGFEFDEEQEWHLNNKKRKIDDWLAQVASPESLPSDENYTAGKSDNVVSKKSKNCESVTENLPVWIEDYLSQELFAADECIDFVSGYNLPLNDDKSVAEVERENSPSNLDEAHDELTVESSDESFFITIGSS